MISPTPCPCGSGHDYTACCGPSLEEGIPAATALALMRSRYVAYVQGNDAYLLATWHPSTRPETLDTDTDGPVKWLGLKILGCEAGGTSDHVGWVEFVARYKTGGRGHRLHERSRFRREDGRWYYVDGVFPET